jgi:hypothetical protein
MFLALITALEVVHGETEETAVCPGPGRALQSNSSLRQVHLLMNI